MSLPEINIVPFSDELAVHFTSLNRAWVQKYFVIEPLDEAMLGNPKKFFIEKGSHIFFAKLGEEVAGTFALLKEGDGIYELSKMAVSEKFQGQKIGNHLLEFCIATATALGAKKIQLHSNTILGPAIHLYKKYGFIEVPLGNPEYKRSNIKMELLIQQ
jgi:ribosomal protein S18 acetylase RimI-like enzyme